MAFTASAVLREWMVGPMYQASGTGYTGLDSDAVKVALFNNSVTPDKDAAVANTGYNTGTWLTANEVTDATNWTATGRTLASKTITTPASGVVMFDAADTAGGGNVTIANAYGVLVYDDSITAGSVADQGICFLSFGGSAAGVTAGSFTIAWHANGLCRWTSS